MVSVTFFLKNIHLNLRQRNQGFTFALLQYNILGEVSPALPLLVMPITYIYIYILCSMRFQLHIMDQSATSVCLIFDFNHKIICFYTHFYRSIFLLVFNRQLID